MKPETLQQANELDRQIKDLEQHKNNILLKKDKITKDAPLSLNYRDRDYNDAVRMRGEFMNIGDIVSLYEKRIDEKLHDLKLKLEAL